MTVESLIQEARDILSDVVAAPDYRSRAEYAEQLRTTLGMIADTASVESIARSSETLALAAEDAGLHGIAEAARDRAADARALADSV